MEKKYLAINIGSASKKYGFYGDDFIFGAHLEKSSDKFLVTVTDARGRSEMEISADNYESGSYFLELIKNRNIISDISEISAIGIRIVSPGSYFLDNKIIDGDYITELKKNLDCAPLHITPTLVEIEKIKAWSESIPLYGVSDSVFYKDMDEESKIYGLPKNITEELGLYRFGYHGISMSYVLSGVAKIAGVIPERVVICHLGSGSSISAIKNGRPIDTSMGFTPLEGVPMGSRVGNIDAGAVIYMAKKLGYSFDKLEAILNSESGLLAVSGKSQFIKELIDMEKSGDEKVRLSLSFFSRSVKKYIGGYTAILGGLDMLIFTGTAGERSNILRSKICSRLESLGIIIDQVKNSEMINKPGFIESKEGLVKIAVIPADELAQIVKEIRS